MPQPALSFDYSGGFRKYGTVSWRRFHPVCRGYDGPRLVYGVAACKARNNARSLAGMMTSVFSRISSSMICG